MVVQRQVTKSNETKEQTQKGDFYQNVEEVIHDLRTFNDLLKDLLENTKIEQKWSLAIEMLLNSEEHYTLHDVAKAVMPHLLIGESHEDLSARRFLLKYLNDLQNLGIKTLILELDSTMKLTAKDVEEVGIKNVQEITLQQVCDQARNNDLYKRLLKQVIPTGIITTNKNKNEDTTDVELPNLIIKALETGINIVCGDNLSVFSPNMSLMSSEVMAVRDTTFANKITEIASDGGKVVLLVGGKHLTNINKNLKESLKDKKNRVWVTFDKVWMLHEPNSNLNSPTQAAKELNSDDSDDSDDEPNSDLDSLKQAAKGLNLDDLLKSKSNLSQSNDESSEEESVSDSKD